MANINVRVPNSLRERGYISGSSTALSVKQRLVEILDSGFGRPGKDGIPVIKEVPAEPSSTAIIWVSDVQLKQLDFESALDAEKGLKQINGLGSENMAQFVRYLLTAHAEFLSQKQSQPDPGPTDEETPSQSGGFSRAAGLQEVFAGMPKPMKAHDEQVRLYLEMDRFLADNTPGKERQVLFAEAGTGIGKTLTYLSLALQHVRKARAEGDMPFICIAVPTYNHVTELLDSWHQRLQPQADFQPAALASKRDFVSEQALKNLLQGLIDEQEPCAQRLRDWIANPVAAAGFRNQSSWTMQGLSEAVPEFMLHDLVRLDSRDDDNDLGYLAYQAQWRNAMSSPIWIMTHAMLASLTKSRLAAHRASVKATPDVMAQAELAIENWRARRAVIQAEREKEKENTKKKNRRSKKEPPAETDDATLLEAADAADPVLRGELLHRILNDLYRESNLDDVSFMSKLPDFDLTIVDEAHMIDASFDLVLSNRISLWSLLQDLRRIHHSGKRGVVTKRMVDELQSLRDRLQKKPTDIDSSISVATDEGRALLEDMYACCLGVSKAELKGANQSVASEIRRVSLIERSIRIALKVMSGRQGMDGYFDWSPDKKWPRLVLGRSSLGAEMDYLWSVVSQKSILISGTLYEYTPAPSVEYARRNLAVRPGAAVAMSPIHAPWQFSSVTVQVIGEARRPDESLCFSRPGMNESKTLSQAAFEKRRKAWIDEVAHYIWRAHGADLDGQRGMLVLCTAFADIKDVGTRLIGYMDSFNSKQPVLMHQPDTSLMTLKGEFRKHLLAGERPVLFGAGPAWTGFDLHWDDIACPVTDLVVVNAPFGAVSRLISHQKRGFMSAAFDMAILVRQGIGRLVRSKPRPGEARRVHWLDSRIHQLESSSWSRSIRMFLSKYKIVNVS